MTRINACLSVFQVPTVKGHMAPPRTAGDRRKRGRSGATWALSLLVSPDLADPKFPKGDIQ